MDRICGAVFDRIRALSPAGRYVIIAEDEFYEAFPEGSEKSYDELERALSALRSGGYIDLKYSRGEMYCVAPLKERIEDAPAPSAPAPQPRKQRLDFVLLSAFIGSALGSFVAALIISLI